jgi:NADH dehydrogenase
VSEPGTDPTVLIVGGGFAGVACAQALAKEEVATVLVDRNGYHQFQPMLYQLATGQVGDTDIAFPLRGIFKKAASVRVLTTDVTAIDPVTRSVTTAEGSTLTAQFLVIAAGAVANFFGVPGAAEHSFPLYCMDDANALRSHIIGALTAVDANPSHVDQGGLTFVVVGGGPTGVETAGAFAEALRDVVPRYYTDAPIERARVILIDRGEVVLNGFSPRAHRFAAKVLEKDGVELRLGTGVEKVTNAGVHLSDGSTILTKTVVWGGGEQAAPVVRGAGFPTGAGGRVDVEADLTVAGFPGVYALGDAANITGSDGETLPQLGSVAQQSGRWAGRNIVADLAGKDRTAFRYRDKGIMAMIGRNAAVAEMGAKRHEVDGHIAFAAWLGVHAELLSSFHQRVGAFIDWGWDYFSSTRPEYVSDRPEAHAIDWSDDEDDEDDEGTEEG